MNSRIRRRICNRFINRVGVITIIKRVSQSIQLDKYGEPVDELNVFTERQIKIVINTDKREVKETEIGGLPNNTSKEILSFYTSATEDISTGDKIVYPPNTPNEWIIYFVQPTALFGDNIMIEAKCHRDSRY
jgi:hypothetical protein